MSRLAPTRGFGDNSTPPSPLPSGLKHDEKGGKGHFYRLFQGCEASIADCRELELKGLFDAVNDNG